MDSHLHAEILRPEAALTLDLRAPPLDDPSWPLRRHRALRGADRLGEYSALASTLDHRVFGRSDARPLGPAPRPVDFCNRSARRGVCWGMSSSEPLSPFVVAVAAFAVVIAIGSVITSVVDLDRGGNLARMMGIGGAFVATISFLIQRKRLTSYTSL